MSYEFFLFVKLYDSYFTQMDVLQTPYDQQYDIYHKHYETFMYSAYQKNLWYWEWRSIYDCMIDFLEDCSKSFAVMMDGKVMKYFNTYNECFKYILDHQSQSVDWAMKHWWYSIVEF